MITAYIQSVYMPYATELGIMDIMLYVYLTFFGLYFDYKLLI